MVFLCHIQVYRMSLQLTIVFFPFSFGATALIWAMAYLHEIFRFTSVY
jgi:hypothetical protein